MLSISLFFLMKTLKGLFATLVSLTIMVGMVGIGAVFSSSHREAPLISSDPAADQTDLYAFVSPQNADNVVLIGNYYPLIPAGGGPNYFNFDPSATYVFHIDNNGDAREDVSYAFQFRRMVKNGSTFLYNTQPLKSIDDSNVTYLADVYRFKGKMPSRLSTRHRIARSLPVAPPVIGSKSQPNYAELASQAISDLGTDGKYFFGQRDDSFFVDLNVFDLLNLGGAIDSLAGFNVNTIAFEVPAKDLAVRGDSVIGIWGATYRNAFTVIRPDGKRHSRGRLVQVSRLGMPLVNEVVVPLAYKDYFNSSHPSKDADTQAYADVVLQPELATLFEAVLGLDVPASDRTDIFEIFLKGVPDLNQPRNVRPAEMLRLNTAIAPSANPNAMGVLGGDLAGFPNGRRLGDDVTDIAIQVVAGVLAPTFGLSFVVPEGYTELGDGVTGNDLPFSTTFPYIAGPHL